MEQPKIIYEADQGRFIIIQGTMLWRLFFGNKAISEKYISICQNNQLRKMSNSTVLTSYDVDLLYRFAKKKFNFTNDIYKFETTPLKCIFADMTDNESVGNLLIQAYDYFNS